MVTFYHDLMIRFLEVVVPLLYSLHHDQEHPIIYVMVQFGTCRFLRVDVDRSENRETLILVENAGYGEAACISQQNNRLCC